MIGNGKVFISHAHDDASSCVALLAALDAWGVDYWFDAERLDAGHDLSERIQRALEERDIFIRMCSTAAKSSYWVRLETGAFRGLQAKDQKMGHSRVLINLVIDSGYSPEPFDLAYIYIDATDKPQREWILELQRALHLGQEGTAVDPDWSGDRRSTSQRPTQQAESKYVESDAGAVSQSGVPRVVVRQGKEVGRVFTLHAANMYIGSGSSWPIQLSDPNVDRSHALIRRKSTGKRYIHDIGSKTGTFVNGKLIDSEQELHDGDEIRIGNTLLVYEEGKESS